MDESQNLSSQGQDVLGDEVMEDLGVSNAESHEPEEAKETNEGSHSNATLAVQKRLKAQKRAHEREVRELHARIGDLEARMSQPNNTSHDQTMNHDAYGIDENIHKAVSYALQQKEAEERKAKDAQMAAHVQRKYHDFQRHLDAMNDKYDDFHDVVMAPDAAFTPAMRDYAARTMSKSGSGSAGEVLYKLAKNPDDLKRIANLHPDDQAEELHKLSLALSSGGENKSNSPRSTLGNIKSNPVVNTNAVTEKTSVSDLRKLMKSGWK